GVGPWADRVDKEAGAVAGRIGGRLDAGPFAAIDQDQRRAAARRLGHAASPGGGKPRRRLGDFRDTGARIAVGDLPALPAGAAELAGEIEALEVMGSRPARAPVMVGNQCR